MPESDPVDMLPKLTEDCKPKCTVPWSNYQKCTERLAKRTDGDCEAWYFDYYKCLDKCRVPQVFKHVK